MVRFEYQGRYYKSSELPELARLVFGDEIYEELVRQIKLNGRNTTRDMQYVTLSPLEEAIVEDRKAGMTYAAIAKRHNIMPAEVAYTYKYACKKMERKSNPGSISNLNISTSAANTLIETLGEDDMGKLAADMDADPNKYINASGFGYIAYITILEELRHNGYEMPNCPVFENVAKYSHYKAGLEL